MPLRTTPDMPIYTHAFPSILWGLETALCRFHNWLFWHCNTWQNALAMRFLKCNISLWLHICLWLSMEYLEVGKGVYESRVKTSCLKTPCLLKEPWLSAVSRKGSGGYIFICMKDISETCRSLWQSSGFTMADMGALGHCRSQPKNTP